MAEPRKDTQQGGQELPADQQDRPEQNEGYDEAARAGGGRDDAWTRMEQNTPPSNDPDDRAADEAARDVRRRERSAGR